MNHDFSQGGMLCTNCGLSARRIVVRRQRGEPDLPCEKPKCKACGKEIEPFDPDRIVHIQQIAAPPSSPYMWMAEEVFFCTDKCYLDFKAGKADDPIIV